MANGKTTEPARAAAPKTEEKADEQPIAQTDTPVAAPALPLPDPLPLLDRPIFDPPRFSATHTTPLHPGQPSALVESAVEELRMRLGELREFLKRFPHELGGDLGGLVTYLRTALVVPKHDPAREADRRREDDAITGRRNQEDLIAPPDAMKVARRAEEDAGLATLRRIQDTSQ